MRMFAGAAFVNVDDPAIFGRCLPRWENMTVNFYERASQVVRGWAPIMGLALVVRDADCGPSLGCCGCVVGRVVEVESIGVRGCTRRPVLDFRPTVGVIVAVCAGPATSVAPSWQIAPCRVVSPRGFHGCAPMMGAGVVVRNADSRPVTELVGVHPFVRNAGTRHIRPGRGLCAHTKTPAAQTRGVCVAGACCVKLLGRR